MRSLVLASTVASTVASADPMSIGFRVGGYGFRRANSSTLAGENSAWELCRMNGLGLFGTRSLTGPLFLEASLDTYFSTAQAQSTALPLDRQSGLVSIAAGARMEVARLSVPYGDSQNSIHDDKIMPDGFFGIGGDIRIARGTYIGANLRTLVMGNFDYASQRLQMSNQWVAPPLSRDVFS